MSEKEAVAHSQCDDERRTRTPALDWLGAMLAVVGAAFIGFVAPAAVSHLAGVPETDVTVPATGALQLYFSAMAAIAVAYLLAPTRSGRFAVVVFTVGALGCASFFAWFWVLGTPQVYVGLFLAGCLGGISSFASCIAVRRLRARVPDRPLQPTSGGGPESCGSMGDAARG